MFHRFLHAFVSLCSTTACFIKPYRNLVNKCAESLKSKVNKHLLRDLVNYKKKKRDIYLNSVNWGGGSVPFLNFGSFVNLFSKQTKNC